jgi:hypothetical protein
VLPNRARRMFPVETWGTPKQCLHLGSPGSPFPTSRGTHQDDSLIAVNRTL